jgi:hypothetical protein
VTLRGELSLPAHLRNGSRRFREEVGGDRRSRRSRVLAAIRGTDRTSREAREIPTGDLRVGMVLAEEVKAPNGLLLVARGHEVSARLLERVRNFPPGMLENKLWRVVLSSQR